MYRLTPRTFVIASAILLLLLGILGGTLFWLRHEHPLPKSVRHQVSFVVLYPGSNSGVSVDTASHKYDTSNKVLSYTVARGSTHITVSEQPTPEAFSDIPQAYDKLVQSLGEYGSFDSLFGKVYLTRPKDLGGDQSAVMNAKGTLLFAHPANGELSTEEWRKFFNSLRVVK